MLLENRFRSVAKKFYIGAATKLPLVREITRLLCRGAETCGYDTVRTGAPSDGGDLDIGSICMRGMRHRSLIIHVYYKFDGASIGLYIQKKLDKSL
jgi:hypothetical protein